MDEYEYELNWMPGWELQYVAGKIYSALNTSPSEGLFDGQLSYGGGMITIYFYRSLDATEKMLLDGVMAQSDVGAFPDLTGKVVIEFPDFLNDWKSLETALGLDIGFASINPYNGHIFLVLNDAPNTAKKNALFQKMRDLVKITKNGLSV